MEKIVTWAFGAMFAILFVVAFLPETARAFRSREIKDGALAVESLCNQAAKSAVDGHRIMAITFKGGEVVVEEYRSVDDATGRTHGRPVYARMERLPGGCATQAALRWKFVFKPDGTGLRYNPLQHIGEAGWTDSMRWTGIPPGNQWTASKSSGAYPTLWSRSEELAQTSIRVWPDHRVHCRCVILDLATE